MAEYSTQDFRKNLKIEIDGEPFIILEAKHVKPGKGVAFVKTRYKSLLDGSVFNQNFRSGDKVDVPDLESREMEYLYRDEDHFIFMDTQNYEQIRIGREALESENVLEFLKDNLEVEVLFHNQRPISVELPNFVELEVTETAPGVRGDTVQGGTKEATLETGVTVQVPLYLDRGEIVRVDTRTGEYVERVNT
jgi:elongation factor P